MYNRIKKRTYQILSKADKGDKTSLIFDIFIISLIILNILAFVLESVKSIKTGSENFFYTFELFSIVIFTIEYLLRIWSCTVDEEYKHPVWGRVKFAFSFFALVDLIAILPFYIGLYLTSTAIGKAGKLVAQNTKTIDLRFVRGLRLFRLLRLLKIGRFSNSIITLKNVFKKKLPVMLIILFVTFILLILVSSIMYFVEGELQPTKFSSIPQAMWWGITTLSTVGYGDVTPMTDIGKLITAIIAVLGIGLFALPAGILGSAFVEELEDIKKGYYGTYFSDHIVIVGWNNFAELITDQLVKMGEHALIITENEDDLEFIAERYDTEKVFTLYSEFTNFNLTKKAGLTDCRIIFINIDDDTAKLDYMLRAKDFFGDNLTFAVIPQNEELIDIFKENGAMTTPSKYNIASKLLASFMFEPYVAELSENLLTPAFTEDEYDIVQYSIDAGHGYSGKLYHELFFEIKKSFDSILIGITKIEDGKRQLHKNPEDKNMLVQENDTVLLITDGKTKIRLKEYFRMET